MIFGDSAKTPRPFLLLRFVENTAYTLSYIIIERVINGTLHIFLLLFVLKVKEFSPKTSDTLHLLTSNLTEFSLDYFKGLSPCNEVMQF